MKPENPSPPRKNCDKTGQAWTNRPSIFTYFSEIFINLGRFVPLNQSLTTLTSRKPVQFCLILSDPYPALLPCQIWENLKIPNPRSIGSGGCSLEAVRWKLRSTPRSPSLFPPVIGCLLRNRQAPFDCLQ